VIICRATEHDDGTLGANLTRDNILYLIIGALVIVTTVLSYQLYQDRKQPEGMHIDLGPNGLSIEKK
jgi:predicted negative regulator of RcsB-dependent stress response